jgi:hypothetical protein
MRWLVAARYGVGWRAVDTASRMCVNHFKISDAMTNLWPLVYKHTFYLIQQDDEMGVGRTEEEALHDLGTQVLERLGYVE